MIGGLLGERPPRRTIGLLLAFVALALVLGWTRARLWQAPVLIGFDLASGHFSATPMGGPGWSVDIASLDIADSADDYDATDRSRLMLFEDGIALAPHGADTTIKTVSGHFRQFRDRLTVSTIDGGNPLTNGHHYLVVANVPADIAAGLERDIDQRQWKFHDARSTRLVLAGGLALLLLAGCLSVDPGWIRFSAGHRQLALLLVFAAAASGIALDAASHWRDFAVSADTESYQVSPLAGAYRTPGYWAFGRLVLGGKWQPDTEKGMPVEQSVPPGLFSSPLHRLAHVQQGFAVVSVVVLGLALTWLMPAPLAAALTLLAGDACIAFPWASTGRDPICVLLAIAFLAMLLYRFRVTRWRGIAAAATGSVAAAIAVTGLLQFGFIAGRPDWLMSDGLAVSLELLLLASVLGFAYGSWRWWVPLTALAAALVYLVRPSDSIDWLLVAGMTAIAVHRSGLRCAIAPVAVVTALFGFGVILPSLMLNRLSVLPPVPERHLLAFATIIADDGDLALMPDAESREYLQTVLPRMAEARRTDPNFRQGLVMYFNKVAYEIAWPAVAEVAVNTQQAHPDRAARAIAQRVAHAILRAHVGRYLTLVKTGIPDAIYSVRFSHVASLWLIAAVVLGGGLLLRTVPAMVATMLLAASVAGTVVPLMTSVPIGRLIEPVDPFICLALLIVAAESCRSLRSDHDDANRLPEISVPVG